jgi:Domain of Unknown Function (DUF1259)
MKLSITTGILLILGAPALLPAALTEAQRTAIDQATGAKGAYTEAEDTHKVTFPRTDIKVTVEGRPMPPFLGFSSWAAFTPGSHGGLMVMGDVVLLEDEVNPAMSAALDAGLEVTALHNQLDVGLESMTDHRKRGHSYCRKTSNHTPPERPRCSQQCNTGQ